MRNFLNNSIINIIQKKRASLENELRKLKAKLEESTSLPKEIISMAADLAGLKRYVMIDYMEKNGEKRNHYKRFISAERTPQ